MDSRRTISLELQTISPLIANINPVNPYQLPNGYFEGLVKQIMQRIETEGESSSGVLEGINNELPYKAPQGYFEGLADNILKRIKALEASSPKEELNILSPLLGRIDRKVPFSTPSDYFEELTESVVVGTKAIDFVNEELENLSPVMTGLRHKQVYEVPVDYFESLPGKLLSLVRVQQPSKVVSLNFAKKIRRYAIAAVVTGIIIVGGLLFLNRPAMLSSDPVADVEKKIETATDNEIENFLENLNLSNTDENISTASADIDEHDLKEMFADVSEEELNEYINEYGNAQNAVTN